MAKTTLNFIWRYPIVALLAFFCLGLAAIASPTHGAESVNGDERSAHDREQPSPRGWRGLPVDAPLGLGQAHRRAEAPAHGGTEEVPAGKR